jgi:hypothetical protein
MLAHRATFSHKGRRNNVMAGLDPGISFFTADARVRLAHDGQQESSFRRKPESSFMSIQEFLCVGDSPWSFPKYSLQTSDCGAGSTIGTL